MQSGFKIVRRIIVSAILPACLVLPGGVTIAAGQALPTSSPYRIKPSEVALPQGVAPGQYRRIIQPFPNWTLICDENLKKKQKTCNVTQTIVDESGALAFSWSLAATTSGQPIMILRLPAQVGVGSQVAIDFAGGSKSAKAKVENCDPTVCVVLLPVGPVMRTQINKQVDTQITYTSQQLSSGSVVINTTFKGLPTALAAIK